ncbi:hypothetical protein LOK49_LG05G02200 [Camellia lanceoleosa]|uniref:Uncharacterized protein n=1 Tax=Camellia lanceoleosa TaxID=1840588 RepID=A0ACC0HS80_9ERIC|nr:hypothetical protein LOK49_LG05G02200 [Camellia lanceoleosa]
MLHHKDRQIALHNRRSRARQIHQKVCENRADSQGLSWKKHLTCPTKTREALKICSYSLLLDGFGWLLPYIGVYNKV